MNTPPYTPSGPLKRWTFHKMYDSMVCWALAVNMSWDRCKQSRERLHMLTQSICWHWWTVDFYLSSKDTGRLQYLLSCWWVSSPMPLFIDFSVTLVSGWAGHGDSSIWCVRLQSSSGCDHASAMSECGRFVVNAQKEKSSSDLRCVISERHPDSCFVNGGSLLL